MVLHPAWLDRLPPAATPSRGDTIQHLLNGGNPVSQRDTVCTLDIPQIPLLEEESKE